MKQSIPKLPRGRPRTFDRATALQAALKLFLERGYEGTALSDLVAAMGIAPPSLYAAFGSKEGLYRETLDLYLEGRGRFVSRALERKGLCCEDLVRQILRDAAVAFTPGGDDVPGCMVSATMLACSPNNREVGDHVKALRAAPTRAVAQRIEQAKANGELPPSVNSEALARFFASVVAGMSIQARDGATRRQLLELAESAMQAWPK